VLIARGPRLRALSGVRKARYCRARLADSGELRHDLGGEECDRVSRHVRIHGPEHERAAEKRHVSLGQLPGQLGRDCIRTPDDREPAGDQRLDFGRELRIDWLPAKFAPHRREKLS
jgi:hypothetical protein